MLKHIGRQQQQQPAVIHHRTPSNGSMIGGHDHMGYPASSPIGPRPPMSTTARPMTTMNTSSMNSPTHSASPTAIGNQTKTTLASNLDDSLAAFHHSQQHNGVGPLSSSHLFERSVQQVPNGHTSYLSSR